MEVQGARVLKFWDSWPWSKKLLRIHSYVEK